MIDKSIASGDRVVQLWRTKVLWRCYPLIFLQSIGSRTASTKLCSGAAKHLWGTKVTRAYLFWSKIQCLRKVRQNDTKSVFSLTGMSLRSGCVGQTLMLRVSSLPSTMLPCWSALHSFEEELSSYYKTVLCSVQELVTKHQPHLNTMKLWFLFFLSQQIEFLKRSISAGFAKNASVIPIVMLHASWCCMHGCQGKVMECIIKFYGSSIRWTVCIIKLWLDWNIPLDTSLEAKYMILCTDCLRCRTPPLGPDHNQ